jgi:Skp family chaperone for outer membrane proteins
MKIKTMALSCLICLGVLFVGHEFSRAEAGADRTSLKTGVVNVRRIFRECKRNITYRAQAVAEQSKVREELEKLAKEIDVAEAGLKVLRPGSDDHLAQVKAISEKRANLNALQDYNKQQRALKDKQWTERLYEDILQVTGELAQEKGLDLVFDKDEPEFPASSSDALMLTLSTNKLLYSAGCLDITDEVIAQLDTVGGTSDE